MPNKKIFSTSRASRVPVADTVNAAGGKAYKSSDRQALAQIAATNCFNGTYYVSAEDNLNIAKTAALALKGDPEFIAKCAVYSRSKGHMKDMPAFLTAMLATMDSSLFRRVFPKVIDNGKMLRNFCQIARSGAVGKTINLSSQSVRKAIGEWFATQSPQGIFNASIGQEFPLQDILRAAFVKPASEDKAALLAYLRGVKLNNRTGTYQTFRFRNGYKPSNSEKQALYEYIEQVRETGKLGGPLVEKIVLAYEHKFTDLPLFVQQYENYKKDKSGEVPNVDFRMLDSLGLEDEQWKEIALRAPWQMTRMNLNTFARHNVFKSSEAVKVVADRLRDRQQIERSRVFPYTLMTAWKAIENNADIPKEIRNALQDAMEIACDNVPEIDGQIYICVDASGSMQSAAITGSRGTATSSVRCLDVAALFAASLLRKNKNADVLVFCTRLHSVTLNARDSIATNANIIAKISGGGTACQVPLADLNAKRKKGDAVIYVSDNESWVDGSYFGGGTAMYAEWLKFQERNKDAKLICMDLTPRANSQVKEKPNVLQVGGFSDNVFNVVASFIKDGNDANHWVKEIEALEI